MKNVKSLTIALLISSRKSKLNLIKLLLKKVIAGHKPSQTKPNQAKLNRN